MGGFWSTADDRALSDVKDAGKFLGKGLKSIGKSLAVDAAYNYAQRRLSNISKSTGEVYRSAKNAAGRTINKITRKSNKGANTIQSDIEGNKLNARQSANASPSTIVGAKSNARQGANASPSTIVGAKSNASQDANANSKENTTGNNANKSQTQPEVKNSNNPSFGKKSIQKNNSDYSNNLNGLSTLQTVLKKDYDESPSTNKQIDIFRSRFEKLIKLYLIIQKLTGKLESPNKNTEHMNDIILKLIKDYIYKSDKMSSKMSFKNKQELSRTEREEKSKELFNGYKEEISKKSDSECKKLFNKEIYELWSRYNNGKYSHYIEGNAPEIKINNSQNNNNNARSNASTVVENLEQNNLNAELSGKNKNNSGNLVATTSTNTPQIEVTSGGSRKKSKKSRS